MLFNLNRCCTQTLTPISYLPIGSVGQSADVGHQCAVSSVSNGEKTQIEPSVVAVLVEATNFTATASLEGVAQGEHVGEGQQRLGGDAWGAYRGVES